MQDIARKGAMTDHGGVAMQGFVNSDSTAGRSRSWGIW